MGLNESVFSKTMGTLQSGSGSINGSGEPIPMRPMDKFFISQSRQSTLNSKWKLEERKCVEKLVDLCTQKVSHLMQ